MGVSVDTVRLRKRKKYLIKKANKKATVCKHTVAFLLLVKRV